jgi:hypothetical protein
MKMNTYAFLNELSWLLGISPIEGELFWDEIWKDSDEIVLGKPNFVIKNPTAQ